MSGAVLPVGVHVGTRRFFGRIELRSWQGKIYRSLGTAAAGFSGAVGIGLIKTRESGLFRVERT